MTTPPFDAATIHQHLDDHLVARIHAAIDHAAGKHGVRRRELGTTPGRRLITIDLQTLQRVNDTADRVGPGAPWLHLAGEECAETITADTPAHVVDEALQTIQILVAMIADIETRNGAPARGCGTCGHRSDRHDVRGCWARIKRDGGRRVCSCRGYVPPVTSEQPEPAHHSTPDPAKPAERHTARHMPRWANGDHRTLTPHPAWRVIHRPMYHGDERPWLTIAPGDGRARTTQWFPTWREAFDHVTQEATR